MKLKSIKSLQKKAERIWKEIILIRDGKVCLVQRYFPEIEIGHTDNYQADHCYTRLNKFLFLEPDNGTMICSGCNTAKGFHNKSIDRAVDDIVRDRVGEERFKEMRSIDQSKSANVNWGKRWWLEEQIAKLEELRSDLLTAIEIKNNH